MENLSGAKKKSKWKESRYTLSPSGDFKSRQKLDKVMRGDDDF